MKRVLLLAFLLALTTPLIAAEKLPAYLQKCPFGHEDIVLVPIGYGLPIADKRPEKDTGIGKLPSEFQGGCVIEDDAPREAAGCPKCGFYYLPLSNRSWSKGEWTLRVAERGELFKPLSPAVSDFPGLEDKSRKVKTSYAQTANRHCRVTSETIGIHRKGKLAEAEVQLKPWLISKGIDPQKAHRSERAIRWQTDRYVIRITREGRMLDISVSHNLASGK